MSRATLSPPSSDESDHRLRGDDRRCSGCRPGSGTRLLSVREVLRGYRHAPRVRRPGVLHHATGAAAAGGGAVPGQISALSWSSIPERLRGPGSWLRLVSHRAVQVAWPRRAIGTGAKPVLHASFRWAVS